MSDSDDSEGTAELKALIAEYAKKEKELDDAESQNDRSLASPIPCKDLASNSKAKKRKQKPVRMNQPVPMDKVIFGDKDGLIQNLTEAITEKGLPLAVTEDELGQARGLPKKRKPAWTDADDEEIQLGDVKKQNVRTGSLDHLRMDKPYKEYLAARFTRFCAQPKWASLDAQPDKAEDSDDEILRTVGFLADSTSVAIPPKEIKIKRLKDLNRATYSEGGITSIQFHPSSTAALVSGERGYATMYSIDGSRNEKLHTIHFKEFPLKCVKIATCGTKAFFGSFRRHYYVYDLLTAHESRYMMPRGESLQNFVLSPCGRYMAVQGRTDKLFLYDAASLEVIHEFHSEETVTGICFSGDSQRIICNSASENVSIFSMRQQQLEHSFIDDGCINGTTLDLSPNQRLLATGSREGVVNIYDFDDVLRLAAPKPERRVFNLTTAIHKVKFNHTSELLGICSKEVAKAVRLVHFPSGTVYKNFPDFKAEIGKIGIIEFSPASGYMALGNRKREVPLFRLKHFMNY